MSRRTLDVSALPAAVLDSRSLVWWGTIVMTVIETLVFAITVAAYFYLRPYLGRRRDGAPGCRPTFRMDRWAAPATRARDSVIRWFANRMITLLN